MINPPKTFVSLGNATQPFYRLLEYLDEIYNQLPKPILVQSGSTIFDKAGYCTQDFLSPEDYTDAITSSDVLIFHAGVGSVINALKANKKPIILPRLSQIKEHVNDHQLKFAIAMNDLGLVYLAHNQTDLTLAVSKALSEKTTIMQPNYQSIQELVSQIFENTD